MFLFTMKRLAAAIVTLFLLSIVIFVIAHLAQGDPASIILGAEASQEQLENLRSQMGLDQPAVIQYLNWLTSALQGDLGVSYFSGDSVINEIGARIEPSLTLAVSAIVLSSIIIVPLGVIAAKYKGKAPDYIFSSISLLGLSIPNFLTSLFLILLFGVFLRILPVSGYRGMGDPVSEFFRYNVMPVVSLALGQAGLLMRMTRSSVGEVLQTDYIKAARAKGMTTKIVLFKHALRNSLVPIITVISQSFGSLLAGTAIVETIFNIPGIGQFIVTSITRRDYAMIQGIVLVVSVMWIAVNFVTDILYGVIDPRIKIAAKTTT